MKRNIKIIFTIFFSASILASSAVTLEEAKALYNKGKYSEALPAFKELYKTPRNAKNASINQWLGVCLYKTGNIKESKKYFEYAATRSVAESNLYLSKIEFVSYNFDVAQTHMSKYIESLSKNDKPIPNDVNELMSKIRNAESMYDHVEKITIIDSINVNKNEFFKHYKISPSIGDFVSSDILPYEKPTTPTFVFATEGAEKLMWADVDSANVSHVYETTHLIDGSWEPYSASDGMLSNGGEIRYPFMMPDGSTLYYSCNGEGSIGGFDIFMSRKNLEDGTYYQPQNIGMPYNSLYNDYLLVIDETTGVGWWASDRTQIPDSVTIYMFIPNEVRANYDSDDENLYSYAIVNSIKDTWQEGADFTPYFSKIAATNTSKKYDAKQFEIEVAKGVVYTSLSDCKTSEGRQYLEQYVDALKNYADKIKLLNEKRSKYNSATGGEKVQLKREILNSEKKLLKDQQQIQYLRNAVAKAERKR